MIPEPANKRAAEPQESNNRSQTEGNVECPRHCNCLERSALKTWSSFGVFVCGASRPHVCTKAVPTAEIGWAAINSWGRRRLFRCGCGVFCGGGRLSGYPASHEGRSRQMPAKCLPFSSGCFPRSDPKRTVYERFCRALLHGGGHETQ